MNMIKDEDQAFQGDSFAPGTLSFGRLIIIKYDSQAELSMCVNILQHAIGWLDCCRQIKATLPYSCQINTLKEQLNIYHIEHRVGDNIKSRW